MYQPQAHEETDLAVLHSLVRAHALGAWVTQGPDGLIANHIPFLLDASDGPRGCLRAHCARANPVWREMSTQQPSVILFQGPETYITPSWYPSKHQHGKAVPTWNYAVVHVHGVPRAIDEEPWLRAHLERLTDLHEAAQAVPWKMGDAPEDYLRKMIGAVVGIEVPIDRIEGKWKVSQNRPVPDRLGVVAGLMSRGDEASAAMATLVQRYTKA
jgi:transcriptional regulator